MGTRHAAFLQGNHLHNGKVVGVEAESPPLVGTDSEVEGESSYQIADQYYGALRGWCMLVIWSFASCHLSSAHFICKTIYQHSLRLPQPICTHEFAIEKTAAELLCLHSANDSCTIASSQLATIKRRLIDLKIEIQPNLISEHYCGKQSKLKLQSDRQVTPLYCKTQSIWSFN